MKLTPPATATWLIAVVLGVLGILLHLRIVQIRIGIESFWLVASAFMLLAVGSLVRRL